MKNILLFTALTMSVLSCTKNADLVPAPGQQITKGVASVAEQTFYIDGTDSVRLVVKSEPTVICNSYGNGETPLPCEINIKFTCTLSKPLDRNIRIELERTNQPELEKRDASDLGTEGNIMDPGAQVFLNVAANTTTMVFDSKLTNINNRAVPDNEFRIVNVSLFTPVD